MSIDIDTIYIGGQWVVPSSSSKITVQSPATGERVGSVIAAGERDVDRAVTAALPSRLPYCPLRDTP